MFGDELKYCIFGFFEMLLVCVDQFGCMFLSMGGVVVVFDLSYIWQDWGVEDYVIVELECVGVELLVLKWKWGEVELYFYCWWKVYGVVIWCVVDVVIVLLQYQQLCCVVEVLVVCDYWFCGQDFCVFVLELQ